MLDRNAEKLEAKTCEACRAEFSCGAKAEKCWCFDIELSAEVSARLRKSFKSCLCKDCLEKENEPPSGTN